MGDSRYSDRYNKHSRSRSRSPFRKNFNERPVERDAKRPRKDSSRETRGKRNRVFVNNIPFECRWMELKDLFREKVGDVTYVELFDDDKGKFNGSGVVEFKTEELAQKAIDIMHKCDYLGRLLNVKMDFEADKGRNRPQPSRGMERDRGMDRDRGMGYGGGGGGGRGNDFRSEPSYNTYGLNPDFLKSLGITGPLTTKIFISNLDYKVTEKKLEEIFKFAGKLLKMELNLDNEGKSKGHAIGEFEHPLEAVQAISMFHGQKLYSRLLKVRMDRFADDDPVSKLPSGLHGIGKGLGVNGQPMQFNRNAGGASNGSGSFGLGIAGSMSGGGSGGGMGVGLSNLGMVSNQNLGMSSGTSMGLSNTMAAERSMMNASSLGMGMVGSGLCSSSLSGGLGGMGTSSGMMAPVMTSSMDTVGRNSNFSLSPVTSSRNFRDSFERSHDAFSSNSVSDTVILGNLPSSFTWQMFKDRFRDVGDVRYAEMKGQGTAMIRFRSVQDAQRAINMMNGSRFDGRPIDVRFFL